MLISNGTVVTVDSSDRVLEPGWIRLADGRIDAVSDRPIEPNMDEEVLDASGRVVMPGLINAHTHLFQTLIRGIFENLPFSDWLRGIYYSGLAVTDEDAHLAARLGAVEGLLSGTTTLLEHHFLNVRDTMADATIAGLATTGVRAVFARTSMDLGDLVPPDGLETPDAATAAAAALIDRHGARTADRSLSFFVGPNTPGISTSGEMALAMTEFATARGLRQSMHVAESRDAVDAVRRRYGVEGVLRWLDGIGALRGLFVAAHSVHLDRDELRIAAERGVAISHNPVSNLFLGDGLAPIAEAREEGVLVALGTDGAASNNGQNMFEVLKVAALLQRGRLLDGTIFPPRQALRMATIDAARALGLDDVTGSIEIGKRADLVVLDLRSTPSTVAFHNVVSQLVHCAPASAVRTVFVDGRRVVDEGRMVTLDIQELLDHAQAAGRRIAARLAA
jgi:5-methylthioadenosine/S-adenosylhomocysteine deaminase